MIKTMEKVNNNIKGILAFALTLVVANLWAQSGTNLTSDKVKIEIEQSDKINDNPVFNDSIKINSELKYGMVERKAPSTFKLKPITAPKLGTTPAEVSKLYNGFVKLGVIDFKNLPFAEFNYGSKYSKNYIYSIGFNHFGSDMKVSAPARARFTQTQLELAGKRFVKNYTLFGDMSYNYNTYRYYGSLFQFSEANEDLNKQGFAMGHIQVGASNTHRDTKIPYHKLTLDYYNIFDHYGMQENRVAFNGLLTSNLKALDDTKLKNLKLDVFATVDWFTYNNSALPQAKNSILAMIKPVFKYRTEKFNARLGASIYSLQDDTSGTHVFFPLAEAEYILIKDVFVAYAKFQGSFQRYDYWEHANTNPFFNTTMALNNTRHFNNAFIGLRGNISSKVNFNVGLETDKMKNLPLYVNDNDTYGNSKFNIVTDQVILSRFYGQLSLDLPKIRIALKGDYRNYTTYSELKAWQLPTITAGFSGKYNFQNLIFLTADVYYLGGMFAREYDMNNKVMATELPGVVDANIGFEYKYSKRLNAFVNVNNFLNKQYRRWNQYPNYGINFLAGASYSF